MDEVYLNSSLTIAAIDAVDGTGRDGILVPRSSNRHDNTFRPEGQLDSRGWTMQERLLSRRILSFTHSGIYWDCRRWSCSESSPCGIPGGSEVESSWVESQSQRQGPARRRLPEVLDWTDRSRGDLGDVWHELVQNYTCRNLTFAEDRLVAFQGVASFYEKCTGTKVVVGLRRGLIILDLLWKRSEPGNKCQRRVPSWSWGAVDGSVDFPAAEWHLANVNVVECAVRNIGKGEFEGELKLRGTLIPIVLREGKIHFVPWSRGSWKRASVENGRYEPGGWPSDKGHRGMEHWRDIPFFSDDLPRRDFTCFALHMGGLGLCLESLKNGKYRRIGLCQWNADLARVLATDFGMDGRKGSIDKSTDVTIV